MITAIAIIFHFLVIKVIRRTENNPAIQIEPMAFILAGVIDLILLFT